MLMLTIFQGFAAVMCPAQAGNPTSTPSPTLPQYVPTRMFDVISVREARPDPGKGFRIGGGFAGNSSTLKLTNVSIEDLLLKAYGVSDKGVGSSKKIPVAAPEGIRHCHLIPPSPTQPISCVRKSILGKVYRNSMDRF
jgi:hypothetical protein